MRIVHIIPSLRKGGAERLAIDICTELARSGMADVRLVILHDKTEYETDPQLLQPALIKASVQLSFLRPTALNIAGLQNFIDAFKPDVIHSHLFEAEIVSRSLYYPEVAWFSHSHDNMAQLTRISAKTFFNKNLLTNAWEKRYLLKRYALNGGNNFIAISKNVARYLQWAVPQNITRVNLLPNALNISRFMRPSNYTFRKTDVLELVNTGTLVNNKNQAFLIEVVQEILRKGNRVHLSLLGDGPNRKTLQEKIDRLGLQQNVTLCGSVNRVEEFLWKADVYVHSSLSEGFGLVLVEAMAAGVPVVSLNAGGNADIIEQGRNGFILNKPDVALFANTILRIKSEAGLEQMLITAGLQTAQKYDMSAYIKHLLELYRDEINRKNSGTRTH